MATVGEIIRGTMIYSAPGASQGQNVFYWELANQNEDDQDILDLLESWATIAWGGYWADIAAGVATLLRIDVDVINPNGTVARNIGSGVINLAGLVGSEVLPAANAAYIQASTALPKTRGRKYVPFVAEQMSGNGTLTATALTELAGMLAEYLLDIPVGAGGTLVPGVLSRTLLAFEPFLDSGFVEAIVAYQRRRKEGVGI